MDSTYTMNQTWGVPCGRSLVQPVFDVCLLERILSRDNLHAAFERVEANDGAPGVDGVGVKDFHEWVKDQWPEILKSLWDGTYVPSPVLRCEIPKDNGTMRLLGIPTVLARTIQQAILQIINPLFDPYFSDFSYFVFLVHKPHQL